MASALAALANATCVFTVPISGVNTDPVTGNVSAKTTTVSYSLFVKVEEPEVRSWPGVNLSEVRYRGYVTSGALDSRVKAGTRASLTFAGEAAVACVVEMVRGPYGGTGLLGATLGDALGAALVLRAEGQV